jgi:motility quorum-sensing regulator/GCU-specific mRNA interferase toxin
MVNTAKTILNICHFPTCLNHIFSGGKPELCNWLIVKQIILTNYVGWATHDWMEKNTRHYDLEEIKKIVANPDISPFTKEARRGGANLGLKPREMRQVVLGLSSSDFYKSMTTYRDNSIWQDVYHGKTEQGLPVYIKLTLYTDGRPPVISFKEL